MLTLAKPLVTRQCKACHAVLLVSKFSYHRKSCKACLRKPENGGWGGRMVFKTTTST